jgi:hypothetical protein
MEHKELLAKIDDLHNASSDIGAPANKTYKGMLKFQQALRAVVELSITAINGKPNTDFGMGYAAACERIIQAIEKELR